MIQAYRGMTPRVADSVFLAPTATVIGDVHIGDESGVCGVHCVRPALVGLEDHAMQLGVGLVDLLRVE